MQPIHNSAIVKWFSPPKSDDPETTRLAVLLNKVLLIIIIGSLIFVPALNIISPEASNKFTADLLFIAFQCIIWVIMKRGFVRQAAYLLLFSLWFYISVALYFFGGVANPVVNGFLVVILIAGVLIGRRGILYTMSGSAISILALVALDITASLPPSSIVLTSTYIWTSTLIILMIAGGVLWLNAYNIAAAVHLAQHSEQIALSSELQLRDAIESLSEGFAIYDADEKMVVCNSNFKRYYGYNAELLVPGVTFEEQIRAAVQKKLVVAAIGREESWIRERLHAFRNPEGTFVQNLKNERWLEVREHRTAKGGMVSLRTDVTERIKTEQALKAADQHLRDLIDTIEGIVWEADPVTLAYTFVSAKAEKLLGYPVADWLNDVTFWPSLIHPEDREEAVNFCILSTTKQQDHAFEYRMIAADGQVVWVQDVVTLVVENNTVTKLRGIIVDITQQKQLAEKLRLSQKMEAVGQLTAGIAHDFNNLLTAINVSAQLIQLKLAPDDVLRNKVDRILDSSQHATNLVRQLMSFSSKQIVEAKVLNVNDSVRQINNLLKHTIGEHISLECKLLDKLWPIKIDPSQLEQILINLVLNARDAMPRGGLLTISTANLELGEDDFAQSFGAKPGDYVLLTIKDSGSGISEKNLEHIFEPFFTTKGVGKGTGLGLSTVYGIVEQNGGAIQVQSKLGVGTTFTIFLPKMVGAMVAQPHNDLNGEIPAGTETILIVEDALNVRDLAFDVLTMQGYHVIKASNGFEALELAANYQATIHLTLTDVVMPGMGGEDVAQKLSAERPEMKILFMSGYTNEAINNDQVLNPGISFIQKPFNPGSLARKVRAVLDSEPIMASNNQP